jgi:hypothetical protein
MVMRTAPGTKRPTRPMYSPQRRPVEGFAESSADDRRILVGRRDTRQCRHHDSAPEILA